MNSALLFNENGKRLPMDLIPSLMLESIIEKMPPASSVRMALTGKFGRNSVERLHPKVHALHRRVHDDSRWIGCNCERKHLILYRILCEMVRDRILENLFKKYDWTGDCQIEVYYIIKEFFQETNSLEDFDIELLNKKIEYTNEWLEKWNKLYATISSQNSSSPSQEQAFIRCATCKKREIKGRAQVIDNLYDFIGNLSLQSDFKKLFSKFRGKLSSSTEALKSKLLHLYNKTE